MRREFTEKELKFDEIRAKSERRLKEELEKLEKVKESDNKRIEDLKKVIEENKREHKDFHRMERKV